MAGKKNTTGSAAPTSAAVPSDVTAAAAERNKEAGGGKNPLKEPIGSSGAQEDRKEEKESGPCGLPKNCTIL